MTVGSRLLSSCLVGMFPGGTKFYQTGQPSKRAEDSADVRGT